MFGYPAVFGIDSHARTTTVCALVVETGETETRTFPGNPHADIAAWMGRFPQPPLGVYESGCTGFVPARLLSGGGVTAVPVAAGAIRPSVESRSKKNDRRDAARLARLAAAGGLREVWVPSEEVDALGSALNRCGALVLSAPSQPHPGHTQHEKGKEKAPERRHGPLADGAQERREDERNEHAHTSVAEPTLRKSAEPRGKPPGGLRAADDITRRYPRALGQQRHDKRQFHAHGSHYGNHPRFARSGPSAKKHDAEQNGRKRNVERGQKHRTPDGLLLDKVHPYLRNTGKNEIPLGTGEKPGHPCGCFSMHPHPVLLSEQ